MTRGGDNHLTKIALGVATAALLLGCEGVGLIEGRYLIQGSNGDVVLDTVTGLEWKRCSLGQDWNGSICIREAGGLTSQSVKEMNERLLEQKPMRVYGNPHADPGGWRVPTKDELRTLVYCSNGNPARFKDSDEKCYGNHQVPTIVQRAFPNTPSTRYWSSTPSGLGTSGGFWNVNFSNGQADNYSVGRFPVRLVRGGQ